jgi:hypothetical protein
MPTERFYAVDRIEGEVIVLVDDEGKEVSVPVAALPLVPREGAVIWVRVDGSGAPELAVGRTVGLKLGTTWYSSYDSKQLGPRRGQAVTSRGE